MVRVSPDRSKLLERRIRAAKEGIDLLSVAQDLTTLRKKGERWRGKCPICENGEHSDAFSLDDTLGLFHCFACGSGGDVVRLEHFSRWLIGQPVTTVRKPAQSVPLADGIERLRYGFHQGLLRASLDAA